MYNIADRFPERLIRPARRDDIGAILRFARKFFASTTLKDSVEFDDASFIDTIGDFIDNSGSFETGVFVLETHEPVGVIAGLLYDTWFNANVVTGQDLFWWIEPDYRNFVDANRMLMTLESWAREKGAGWFTLAATENMRPETLEKWYVRRHYQPSERHFIRRL